MECKKGALNLCRIWLFCSLALSIAILDFVSKRIVHTYFPLVGRQSPFYPYGGVGVFENFYGVEFSIVHATNFGAAWGLFSEYAYLLVAARIAMIVGLGIYLFCLLKEGRALFPVLLILVGAFGNVIDFFLYGHVVDLFYFVLWGYRYPIFNVADISICVGIGLLALQYLFEYRRGKV